MTRVTYPPDPANSGYTPQHPSDQPFQLGQMAPPRRGLSVGAILGIVAAVTAVLCIAAGIVVALMPTPEDTPAATATVDPDGMGQPAGAPTDAPTTKGPLTVALGETLIYTSSGFGDDDEVHYTLAAGKPVTRTTYGTKPQKGTFVSVQATIVVKKGSAYACSCDFALITKDGTAFEGTSVGFDGGLDGVELRQGQQAAGLVVFDVPAGAASGAKVELRAGFSSSGNQGFWQLS